MPMYVHVFCFFTRLEISKEDIFVIASTDIKWYMEYKPALVL